MILSPSLMCWLKSLVYHVLNSLLVVTWTSAPYMWLIHESPIRLATWIFFITPPHRRKPGHGRLQSLRGQKLTSMKSLMMQDSFILLMINSMQLFQHYNIGILTYFINYSYSIWITNISIIHVLEGS